MANKIDLGGCNAVVTGGAQGIGRAIVERFLDSGAVVAIWDRDVDLTKKTAVELQKRGRVAPVAVDVTNYSDVERAREETLRALGRIDILVNNAGIAGPNVKTWNYPLDAWRSVLSINLDGPFHCCRALAPIMIAQNYGRIVNMASIAGKEGNPNAPAYSGAIDPDAFLGVFPHAAIDPERTARLAEDAGLKVVMNRCPKIEHGRFSGELGWMGINRRIIDNRKPLLFGKGGSLKRL